MHRRQSEREEYAKEGSAIDPPGYDAGKKIKGRKRHVLVDTLGLMRHAVMHPADIQGRDGGGLVMAMLFGRVPLLTKLFADGGYQGPIFAKTAGRAMPDLSVEIVRRSDAVSGFTVLPKRWVVERSFACFGRCRRLAKDFGNLNRTALAFLHLASIRAMLRRLCRAV